MDNSLQKFAESFSLSGMKKRFALALVAILLGNLPALPSHAESCEGNYCQVSFAYSGQIVEFQVPLGVSSIDFDMAGASGGRGGQGGKVTGTLTNLPDTLYIVVGGQGQIGSQVAGGYNGGGKAGGFRTNEGSGGGASDIRLDLGLDSRILVAGGGGGAGGFSGAPGGAGGGEIAASGQSGQGAGGGGGTQTTGGAGGTSNGGSFSTAGGFGVGGTGGNSINAGGGGGGGGWYGGGGGGADDDNCCSDGGGGGGGSSYANPAHTEDVLHQQGVQLGNGYITLTYIKELVVTEFSALQIDSQTAQFTLGLSQEVNLTLDNFDISGLGCSSVELSGTATNYIVTGSYCSDGNQELKILSGALNGSKPETDLLVSANFDATAPAFSWMDGVVDPQNDQISIGFTLDEGALTAEHLAVVGCELIDIMGSEILLSGCIEGEVSVTIPVGSFSDSWGNSSPDQVLTQMFLIDRTAPEIEFRNLQIDSLTAQHSFEIWSSEPVTFDVSRLSVSPVGCEFTLQESSSPITVQGNCGFGATSYLLAANATSDSAGNTGPQADQTLSFDILEPEPEVSDEPQQETPVGEEPSEPDTQPAPTTEPPSESPATPASPVIPDLPASEAPIANEPVVAEPEENRTGSDVPEQVSESEEVAAEQDLVDDSASPETDAPRTQTIDTGEVESGLNATSGAEPISEGSVIAEKVTESDQGASLAESVNASPETNSLSVSQPRLSAEPIVSPSSNLNIWLITAGGAGLIAASGYLIYRFSGR